jgi:diguanylate cyclase (GGDEF)-like protein
MKVAKTGGVGSSPGVTRIAGTTRVYRADATEQVAPATARAIADTASVSGIPESEFTPRVREALIALMAEVDRLRDELRKSQARIEYLERLVDQDTLVPVNNRRAFVRELTRQLSFSERYAEPSSLVFIDLNGFKEINDTHGHACGDAALKQIGDVLNRNLRSSDYVGRLGGDEFGVILVQADEARATEKANQLLQAIRGTPLPWEGKDIPLDASIGVYTFRSGEDAIAAIAAADAAMYAAKKKAKASEAPD